MKSGSGCRACTPIPNGPMDPAISTSREAASRASRAIFTPRLFRRCTSSPRPSGASLKRFAPNVFVSMICAPASMYAWCTRKTASGSVAFSSSKQRTAPTDSCSIEPMAPSATRIESFSRSVKSWIFTFAFSCDPGNARCLKRSALLFHQTRDRAHQVVLGENFELRFLEFHKDSGIFVAENVGDALDRRGPRNSRQRLAHHFPHHQLPQVLALQ